MKLELIRSSVKEIIERETKARGATKTLAETELTDYIYRAELEFLRRVVAGYGENMGDLAIALHELTEISSLAESSGTYPMPTSDGTVSAIISLRDTNVEIRRVEPRLKGRVLGTNDILKATTTDSVWWMENLLINTAPAGLGTLSIFYVEVPTKQTTGSNAITIPDRYVEAVIKYTEYLAWTAVADLERANFALERFNQVIDRVTRVTQEPK